MCFFIYRSDFDKSKEETSFITTTVTRRPGSFLEHAGELPAIALDRKSGWVAGNDS